MNVDIEKDKKDMNYVPKDNVFDKMNWEICKSTSLCPGAPRVDWY